MGNGVYFSVDVNPLEAVGHDAGGESAAHFVADPVAGCDDAGCVFFGEVGGPPGEGAVGDDGHVGMLDDLEVDDGGVAFEVVVGGALEVAAHALDVVADEEHFVLFDVGNEGDGVAVVVERQADVAAAEAFEFHLGVVGAAQVDGDDFVGGEELAVFLLKRASVLRFDFEGAAYFGQGVAEVVVALEEAFVVALVGVGVDEVEAFVVAHLVVHEPFDQFLADAAVGALGAGVGVDVARQGVEPEVAEFEPVFIAAGPRQGDAAARTGEGVLEHLVPHLAEEGYDTHRR